MRALVPAGGLGSRLRPLTQTGAKQLLPIGNKPIIHYVLEDIRDAGITDVVVLVGTETAAGITANLKDGSEWGLEIRYVHQDQPLGLAHCVITAEELLRGDSFVMYLGDNLHKAQLSPYAIDFKNGSCNATILLSQVSEPREFGVAEFDDDDRTERRIILQNGRKGDDADIQKGSLALDDASVLVEVLDSDHGVDGKPGEQSPVG